MKTIAFLAALAALSACAQDADKPAEPDETALTIDEVAGTYDYTLADGTQGITTMLADGTFSDAMDGEIVTGEWGVADDKVCLDPEGEAAEQQQDCFTLSEPDSEGVQLATAGDGTVVKVRKRAGA